MTTPCLENAFPLAMTTNLQPALNGAMAMKKRAGHDDGRVLAELKKAYSTALTIASITFLASPNTIMVLAW